MSRSQPQTKPSKGNVGDLDDFKWGIHRGVDPNNKDINLYESFVYEGAEYFLYDCAYFYHHDRVETSVGKLVQLYEGPTHEKVVKVVWFFRPSEIRNFLGDYRPSWNELFLASGVGKGLFNINSVESIVGKCSVVCTSRDKRNPEPSESELKTADFFFNCAFDVGKRAIVDEFADDICGIEVGKFFNRKGKQKPSNPLHLEKNIRPKIVIKTRTVPTDSLPRQVEHNAEVTKKRKIIDDRPTIGRSSKKEKIADKKSTYSQGGKSLREEEFDENGAKLRHDRRVKTCSRVTEVTERPDAERRKWFKKLDWGQRLQEAQEKETLVLLNNLDPSYTSDEVEDLVWHALKKKVEARVIEQSLNSNNYYGRALVIFKTKDAAEFAISELRRSCLILEDGRIVTAQKKTLIEPCKQRKFTGHFSIDKYMHTRKRIEMRNAVSTSHCAQPNTIEYDMGVEWILQYKKSDACWEALHKKQMKEIENVKKRLKMDRIFRPTPR